MVAVGVRHLTMLIETLVRVSEWMGRGFVVVVLLLMAVGLTVEAEQRCVPGVVLVVLLLFVQDSRLDCSLLLHELLLVVPVLLLCFRCLFPSLKFRVIVSGQLLCLSQDGRCSVWQRYLIFWLEDCVSYQCLVGRTLVHVCFV